MIGKNAFSRTRLFQLQAFLKFESTLTKPSRKKKGWILSSLFRFSDA